MTFKTTNSIQLFTILCYINSQIGSINYEDNSSKFFKTFSTNYDHLTNLGSVSAPDDRGYDGRNGNLFKSCVHINNEVTAGAHCPWSLLEVDTSVSGNNEISFASLLCNFSYLKRHKTPLNNLNGWVH